MKRLLLHFLSLCLLTSALASAAPPVKAFKKWSQDQDLTTAAPTTGTTSGIDLSQGVTAWRLIVCAPASQAPTGGGVKVWIRANDGLWADTPKLEAQLTFATTGQRCQSFGGFPVDLQLGWLYVTLNGMTLSGAGTQANVRLEYSVQ